MIFQRTIKSAIVTTGIGLHSGRKIHLTFQPGPPDSGILFRRSDLDPNVDIAADAFAVGDTRMASCLISGDVKIATVEHLMSSLAGLGIDNIVITLDGPEVPIMDGSAATFVYLLRSAGIVEQSKPKKFIRLLQTISVQDGDRTASLAPFDGFKLRFTIDFGHPVVDRGGRTVEIDFAKQSFEQDIARARTFGFSHDVEALRAQGLGLGGSLENAIILDEFRVLNSNGLRHPDEFVRHKILDAIGDLYICGHPLLAQFTANKSGHMLNNMLLRKVLNNKDAWEWKTFATNIPEQISRLFPDPQFA